MLEQINKKARKFGRARGGSASTVFSLSAVPLMLMVGAGIDYNLASASRSNLQQATDATALATAKAAASGTAGAALQTYASNYLAAATRTAAATLSGYPSVNSTTGEVCVATTMPVSTAVMAMIGVETVNVSASACSQVAAGSFEIALVLDTTGSMANTDNGGQSKLVSMKNAANSFINTMFDSPTLGPRTKMSVVPFAPSVNVGTGYGPSLAVTSSTSYSTINTLSNATGASWFDNAASSAYHWPSPLFAADTSVAVNRFALFNILKKQNSSWGWGGCVESRPYPLNISDDPPVSTNPDSYFVPLLAPDEPADISHTETYYDSRGRLKTRTIVDATYDNSYIADKGSCSTNAPTGNNTTDQTTAQSRLCKYKSLTGSNTSNSPNTACSSKSLVRLQTAKTDLVTKVNSLTASGNTNIHEGFMWGWRTISPSAPFADGRAYNTNGNQKIIVLMTDGMNTWSGADNDLNGSQYSAYGFYNSANPKLPSTNQNIGSSSQARSSMDKLTKEACDAAKAKGVIIYTIAFSVNSDPIDTQGTNLLKYCATSEEHHYFSPSSQLTLSSAFTQIGNSISQLRLSR